MKEIIVFTFHYKDGTRRNELWYENHSASLKDCFETVDDLKVYVMEEADFLKYEEDFEKVVKIDAEETLYDGAKEVHKLFVSLERGI